MSPRPDHPATIIAAAACTGIGSAAVRSRIRLLSASAYLALPCWA
jgi:hypothetical protein